MRRAVLFLGSMMAKPAVKETNPSGSGRGTIMIPKRISDHPKASQAIFVQIIENKSWLLIIREQSQISNFSMMFANTDHYVVSKSLLNTFDDYFIKEQALCSKNFSY